MGLENGMYVKTVCNGVSVPKSFTTYMKVKRSGRVTMSENCWGLVFSLDMFAYT